MGLSPVSRSKIYIGTAMDTQSADFAPTDFSSIQFTEIKNWTQRGDYGDTAALITDQIIGEGRDQKSKGTRNAGSMQNQFAIKKGAAVDPGMAALVTAVASDSSYAIKVENNDAPTAGSSPKGSVDYFVALVMEARTMGGTANVNRKVTTTLEIVSNIANTPPSAA